MCLSFLQQKNEVIYLHFRLIYNVLNTEKSILAKKISMHFGSVL